MYPVSDEFKQKVRQSHRATVRVEVWQGDRSLVVLEPIAGSIEIDYRRATRRTCSLQVAAPEPTLAVAEIPGTSTYFDLTVLYTTYANMASSVATYAQLPPAGEYTTVEVDSGIVPDDASSWLMPYGNEIRVWRGVELDDGTVEEVPLGVFVITNVEVTESPGGAKVQVTGVDRSIKISRARWTEPYRVAAGATETAIGAILLDRWLDVETSFSATNTTVTRAFLGSDSSNDPWKDALKFAEAIGYDLFFDGDGVAVLNPVRDYETASPDAVYLEDDEAVVLEVRRAINADETYNGVIATGEGTVGTGVYRGEAWDDDPDSPTYRYGAFGLVPRFYSSPLIESDDQAQSAAEAILSRSKGLTEQIDWRQITDPSLDVADVVAIVNTVTKVNKTLVIDRLTIPLDPTAPMSAVARAVSVGVAA
jgi:hypothetical protein